MSLASDLAAAQDLRDKLARVNARITEAQTNRPPQTPADFAAMAAVQARADSTYQKLGWSAPQAMPDETTLQYRRRLLRNLLPKSPQFKDQGAILNGAADVLGVFGRQIYADCEKEARYPTMLEPGELREVRCLDTVGRQCSEFFGSPDEAFHHFKQPIRIAKINDPRTARGQ